MPRYTFEFHEDSAREALTGIELPDDQAARTEAVRAAREIMAEGIFEGIDRSGWILRVYGETGETVATVKFAELVEKRGRLE